VNDPILQLLGLAKKAGRLEIGEEPVGAVCRARRAKLLLLAADAAPNTHRRCAHFGETGSILFLELPHSKAELGFVLGRSSVAILALTDAGFAAGVGEKLERIDPARYGPAAQQLRQSADRTLQRQREKRRHIENLQTKKSKATGPSKKTAPPVSPAASGRPARNKAPAPRPSAGHKRLTIQHKPQATKPAGYPEKRGGFHDK